MEETAEHGKLYNLLFARLDDGPEQVVEVDLSVKNILFFILKVIWTVIKAIFFCIYFCFCACGVWVAIFGYTMAFMYIFTMNSLALEAIFVAASLLLFLTLGYLIIRAIQTKEAKYR